MTYLRTALDATSDHLVATTARAERLLRHLNATTAFPQVASVVAADVPQVLRGDCAGRRQAGSDLPPLVAARPLTRIEGTPDAAH